MMRSDAVARFQQQTIPEPNSGCLLWTGPVNPAGYGSTRFLGQGYFAHRLALVLAGVDVPRGKIVCHRCDTPSCVNPDHLFVGTQGDNMRDMHRKGRARNPMSEKTHCKNGHAFDEENTRVYAGSKPQRCCRKCTARNTRNYRARHAMRPMTPKEIERYAKL